MTPLLDVQQVNFGYGREDVLRDISFQVHQGEIFILLGPNGCGKTTLLDCVLGLLKTRKGSIYLKGTDLNGIPPGQVAQQVAYVPQRHDKTFPYTVNDIVLMGRAASIGMFASPTQNDRQIVEDALARIGILPLKERRYTQISGGEGQMVMIARALAQKTPLLVMDEPTAHLDFRHELLILETIVDLIRETGLSVLMASHFPNQAFYFENSGINTRLALMNDSRFLAVGSPSEILTPKNLETVYAVKTQVVTSSLENGQELKQVIPLSTRKDIEKA